jgi:hypothetical protein
VDKLLDELETFDDAEFLIEELIEVTLFSDDATSTLDCVEVRTLLTALDELLTPVPPPHADNKIMQVPIITGEYVGMNFITVLRRGAPDNLIQLVTI